MPHPTIEFLEAQRLEVQAELDRRKASRERNRLGQFATPAELALAMAALAKEYLPTRRSVRFIDPGVGTGVFLYAVLKTFGERVQSAIGFEIDPEVAATAEKLWSSAGFSLRVEDFCKARPPKGDADKATVILCNPPYVRHHHLLADQKALLTWETKSLGIRVSGLAGLYCYFLLLAHRWLANDGIAVWIVPAEFLDVNYGKAVKEYLASRVTTMRIHRFDPENVQFRDALVSSVVVAFRNAPPSNDHVVHFTCGCSLSTCYSCNRIPLSDLNPIRKWGPLFSGPTASEVSDPESLTVGDLFSVKRGLATGANDYFILKRQQADDLGLPTEFLRPIVPSPRYVGGTVIEASQNGFPKDLPHLVLFGSDLELSQIRKQHPAVARYLEIGERRGIPKLYLPSHRKPWYSQESRPPAPILCTYMGRKNGGRSLHFIRNKSLATAPNVYLLLYPKPALAELLRSRPDAIEQLFEALQELASMLGAGGRVYGGGLNKIEPKELQAIQLPGWVNRTWPSLGKRERQEVFSFG